MELFDIEVLPEAYRFLNLLPLKEREKIYYVFQIARHENNPQFFKKLREEIWEFRINTNQKFYRFLAFRISRKNQRPLVIVTNGFVKKSNKTPFTEITRAIRLREQFKRNNHQ